MMDDAYKISFYDRMIEMLPKPSYNEVPVLVGTLNSPQGINGFIDAEIGHPVFEYKDRYILYLESKTPDRITGYGIETYYKDFKVAIPYYKEDLSPLINFI